MPCRNDGYEDSTRSLTEARNEAAAVACECIKAMLLNDGYDLHDLPRGAEAWFRGHRQRDKQQAIYDAKRILDGLKPMPKELQSFESTIALGFNPTRQKQREVEQIRREWMVRLQQAEASLKLIQESDSMDLGHGLY